MKNVWIAAIVFLPLPAYAATVGRWGRRMQEEEQQISCAFESVSKESYDIASNVRSVKKFAREEREAATQRDLLHFARSKKRR